jgi:hypothetical protein
MSVNLPINDQYRIELTPHSWQISKWRTRSKHPYGGDWEGISWHKTIQQAGESLLLRLVSEDELSGIQDIIDALQSSTRVIAKAIIQSPHHDSWLDEQNAGVNAGR